MAAKKRAAIQQIKTAESKNVFYVGIKEPIEVRKYVLETSKDIVQYLQRVEKFKSVRLEKTENLNKLKETMNELTRLVIKLKSSLPKTSLRTRLHKHEEEIMKESLAKVLSEKEEPQKKFKIEEKKQTIKEAPEIRKPKTELEKLEAELNEIESKLTKLT